MNTSSFQVKDAREFLRAVSVINEAAVNEVNSINSATGCHLQEILNSFTDSVLSMRDRALDQLVH